MKNAINYFLYLIILVLFFNSVLKSQENELEIKTKKKLKIEIPLSSERILMPEIDSEFSDQEIILIPPKKIIREH